MERVVEILREILEIPSPTGYTKEVMTHIENLLRENGIKTYYTNKGALIAGNHPEPELVVAAHVDTLGAMVKGILPDGHLSFTRIGGLLLPTFEGEYCTIITRSGKRYRGTLLLRNPSVHVNKEAGKKERTEENMYIRLDAEVEKKEDTEKLGIRPGDFIAFDPKFEYVNGFVKAHFLDDKASVAVLIDLMLDLGAEALEKLPVAFFFSPYEEVGHGGSAGYPASTKELLVVDMGVVGEGVTGKETAVSIAAHYSSGGASIGRSLEKALKFPPTLANLLALGLVIAGVHLPGWFIEPIKTIGWWSIPLLIIYFGSRITLSRFELRKFLEVGTFRIAIPFLFVFLTLRNASPDVFYSVLVEASMPPAIAANAILAQYQLKAEEAISVTFVLTLIVIGLFMTLKALL